MLHFSVHVDDKDRYSNFESIGYWFSYHVFRCEKHLLAVMSFPGALFMNQDVAMAWKFAGAKRPFIHFSGEDTLQKKQLPADALNMYKPGKYEYVLTELDSANALEFMKIVAMDMIDRYCSNLLSVKLPRLSKVAVLASSLGVAPPLKKNDSYSSALTEVASVAGRMETALSQCKTIAECNEAITLIQTEMGL